ncbi:MAG: hypothetical protein WC803_12675 [Sphingomonas sp.]
MVKQSILTESKTLTDSDSGRTFFLNVAGGLTVTLPSPRAGVRFEFIVKTAPTTAYIITSATNIIVGGIYTSDINAEADSDFETSGVDVITFTANRAKVGDRVEIESDGTNWFVRGFCGINEAITLS